MKNAPVTTPSDDALAEVAGDAAMVALLRGKPADDEVPTAVWWLVAEALRTTVAVRRSLALPPRADDEEVTMLLVEAALLTDAALAELLDDCRLHPGAVEVAAPPGTGTGFALQRGAQALARLLVSHRSTSRQRLAAALLVHAGVLNRALLERQTV